MNRCDFSSISTCLKNHISESNQRSQPDFLHELFEDFMDDPTNQDFSMDNGLVCRWMTGQATLSPKITAYYSKPSNQEKLAHTIHQNLLPLMSDCNMAIQDIYTLFIQDDSISDEFLLNRCDFSSISTCLKNHISESNQMSQPDFLYELFEDFIDDPANQDYSMDNGLVCRWMTGQTKISPKISAYYSKPSNQEKLAHTIHQNLLPLMSDCKMAIQDIYTLYNQDDSISDAKKKNLTPLYKPARSRLLFLAKLISFCMERQFIKRNTKNQKLLAGGALSPIVLDYIMDSEVPKPCRHFIGRDKELEELYTVLEENRHVT